MPHQGLGVVSKAQISCAQSVLPLGRRRDPQPGERQVRFREESTKTWSRHPLVAGAMQTDVCRLQDPVGANANLRR